MAINIDNSLFLSLSLLFLAFIPQFYLLFIFLVMGIGEWFENFFKKISNLALDIYDIIFYIISNPIILMGLIIYLRMSVA